MMQAIRIAAAIAELKNAAVTKSFKVEQDLPVHAEKILALTNLNPREKQTLGAVVKFISNKNTAKTLAKESVKGLLAGLQAKLE